MVVFTRWCHLVFHGVVFRGLEDSGLRDNHGRFRDVFVPLPPDISAWIDKWGARYLLRGSTFLLKLVDAALLIMRPIDWNVVLLTSHILGPYYRYPPLTGEVDNVPRRRVLLVGGRTHLLSQRELAEIHQIFRSGASIHYVTTVAEFLTVHMRANLDMVTMLGDFLRFPNR